MLSAAAKSRRREGALGAVASTIASSDEQHARSANFGDQLARGAFSGGDFDYENALKSPQVVKFSAARAWTGTVTGRGIESSKCLNYDGAASSKTDPLASHPPVGPGRPWRSPHPLEEFLPRM